MFDPTILAAIIGFIGVLIGAYPSFVTPAVEKLFLDVKLQRAEKALENPENNSCASLIEKNHASILE